MKYSLDLRESLVYHCRYGDMASEFDPSVAAKPQSPGWRFWAAFGTLAVNNLAAALDATMLSVALPVSINKVRV